MNDDRDGPDDDPDDAVRDSADAGGGPNGNLDARVRVRGIYTTALTRRLRERGVTVVQASPPIHERFDADFPTVPQDVDADTTGDRQGVGVHGDPDAVAAVTDALDGVGIDTLSWAAAAPRGAAFEGVVTDTLGGGAVVDLGEGSGYLPYDSVEDYVDEGDVLRVQVTDPRPPWSDDRPGLDTGLVASGGLVTLRYGGRAGDSEAARLAELLPVDPPEGWAPRWDPAADDADVDAMAAALERASDRAEALLAAVADADPDEAPARLAAPEASRWVWFGRESRFALDETRRAVATTMPGHHRIKAGTDAASAAVDFAEAVCEPGGEFPFDVVTQQFGPVEGDRVAIGHGKPDGRLVVLGRGEVTARDEATVTVERRMTPGGTYDALGVERRAGDVAVTKFKEGRWWYPTVYRGEEGERRGTYVNVCTPVEVFPGTVRYVDLHVDVVKHADGRVERVDDDELDAAVEAGEVPAALAEKARGVASAVENAL